MAKQLQLRRADSNAQAMFIGAEGELTMQTDKKDLRIHDGVKEGGYRVLSVADVQYNSDTESTWYRKWSDGWVEMGGTVGVTSAGVTINLPVQMQHNTYTITYSIIVPPSFTGALQVYVNNDSITTTSFVLRSPGNTPQVRWHVCGLAA